MEPLRVVHVVRDIDETSGGPPRSISHLSAGLSGSNQEIKNSILFLARGNARVAIASPVEQIPIPYESWSNRLRVGNNCHKLLSQLGTDSATIFHLHGIWDSVTHNAAKFARRHNIPYVWSPRGMLEPWSLRQKRFKKLLYLALALRKNLDGANRLHATAELEAEHLRGLGLTSKISVLPNGIPEIPRPENEVKKRQALFLSRIHPKKGIELLIDAWSKVQPAGWSCKIVGPGETSYVEKLEARIAERGLSDQLKILPSVEDDKKWSLYHESRLFILPTYSENFGIVVAEAMGCGLPVITTDGTPWNILKTANLGWYVTPDTPSIQQALKEATSLTEAELENKGQKAKSHIEEHYYWPALASRYAQLYHEIVAETKNGSK